MIRSLTVTASMALAFPALAQDPAHMPGEEAMFEAFHGQAGVDRIVDGMLDRSVADPRIAGIFAATDMVRLRRTLKEQFCYLLGGPCAYTGRSMQDAHDDIGLQPADMGALVEHLQDAMSDEGVPFHTQNRFLAKLAEAGIPHAGLSRQSLAGASRRGTSPRLSEDAT